MQIPILNGVYTGQTADYKTLLPHNMMPVIQDTGISKAYLRPVEGIVQIGEGPFVSRGAINWGNIHYRVMGKQFCSITEDGTVTQIGDIGDNQTNVSMAYSFDLLAIASNENLFYYYSTTVDDSTWTFDLISEADGFKLIKVTDTDLGVVKTVIWVDGYFMTTDGEFLVVTELNDPTAVNPLKYGSSEVDPDPVVNLWKIRNEVYAVNRYTIEIFNNIGGVNFPFQRTTGAQVHRGAIGRHCSVPYEETIAFLGGARNEAPAVYLSVNTKAQKISTREIDDILGEFTEGELALAVMETLNNKSLPLLWVRLKNQTLVYDLAASRLAEEPIWHVMTSGASGLLPYRARDVIYCYNAWQVGDTSTPEIGILDETISTQFGEKSIWEFGTKIMYNKSMGALIHKLELVALTGRIAEGVDPMISTAYSIDGRLWSQEKYIKAGMTGDRLKRLVWWRQGHMSNVRMQRFRGDSNAHIAIARLEAEIEPLRR